MFVQKPWYFFVYQYLLLAVQAPVSGQLQLRTLSLRPEGVRLRELRRYLKNG